jgi:hypothetical protein
MTLKPIFELGVDEVYTILRDQLGVDDLPPLDAVENEDWGRDLLVGRLIEYPSETLSRLGLMLPSAASCGAAESPAPQGSDLLN